MTFRPLLAAQGLGILAYFAGAPVVDFQKVGALEYLKNFAPFAPKFRAKISRRPSGMPMPMPMSTGAPRTTDVNNGCRGPMVVDILRLAGRWQGRWHPLASVPLSSPWGPVFKHERRPRPLPSGRDSACPSC